MSESKSIICCKKCFSECILCTSLYIFCAFYIIFLIYIPFTIYISYLLIKNFDKNNVLWHNILISTIITNISNYSSVFCNKKKKCIYIYSLNSTINGLLSTTTLILIEHYSINNVLYDVAIIQMIVQYLLVLFNLLMLYYHYTCNYIC